MRMESKPPVRALGLVLLGLTLSAPAARAERMYSAVDLGRGTYNQLNDRGEALGYQYGQNGFSSLIYSGGQLSKLDPSQSWSYLNNNGQMVGTVSGVATIRQPDGTLTPLAGAVPGSTPVAINDAGQVLVREPNDYAILSDGMRRALTSDPNVQDIRFTAFGPHGEVGATAIYGAGLHSQDITLQAGTDGVLRGQLGSGNQPSPVVAFNADGSVAARAYDSRLPYLSLGSPLNQRWTDRMGDVIVGGAYQRLVTPDGNSFLLNDLLPASSKFSLSGLIGMNANGQILAVGSYPDSIGDNTFLLSPVSVPEPSSWMAAVLILAAAVAARRRNRR